jgi:hypothetical protein
MEITSAAIVKVEDPLIHDSQPLRLQTRIKDALLK